MLQWKLGTTPLPQPWPPAAGAALCLCPPGNLNTFLHTRSAPGSAAEGRGSTAGCRHRGGTLTGAVEIGMERHLRTWSHRSNPHLVPAPRTSSRRLRTSGAFGAWEEHRHSQSLPLPEPAPESIPGLPPAFRLLRAEQPKWYKSSRSWAGTAAPWALPGEGCKEASPVPGPCTNARRRGDTTPHHPSPAAA